jgi:3',5'-cyclic-AMP phosphodiesterase
MSFARRSFLQSLLGGSALLGAGSVSAQGQAPSESAFKVAFLTDTHLPVGDDGVSKRVAGLIDAIQARPAAPDLFLFGGDNVMAVDGGQSDADTDEMFKRWQANVLARLKVPSLSCIGNHDIRWKDRNKDKPEEYREKARAVAAFKIPSRFHAADYGGWTFILLDVFQNSGCELDDAQWKWLAEQLKKGETPVCVVTHAPLFSATHFLEPSTDAGVGKGYNVPSGWSPQGLVRFRELFKQNPRVKLCLSGHMHTCDRVDIDNTSYVCGGAVSGNWWDKEDYLGFGPTWIDLKFYPDGRWTHERQSWT